MPREKINDESTQGFYTEVSWRRQPQTADDAAEMGSAPGHVQIASVNALSPFHFPDIDTGDHFEAGEKFDGWRVTLDEAGIDRLIRTLHKAKRQAFGGTGVDEKVGMCGNQSPRVEPGGASAWCDLPHGHPGWHQQGGQRWNAGVPRIVGDIPDPPNGPIRVIGDVTGPGDCWVPTGPNGEGYWV